MDAEGFIWVVVKWGVVCCLASKEVIGGIAGVVLYMGCF
jgi:hypothetical protein